MMVYYFLDESPEHSASTFFIGLRQYEGPNYAQMYGAEQVFYYQVGSLKYYECSDTFGGPATSNTDNTLIWCTSELELYIKPC
jgi:hypothetical protein